MLNTPLIDSLLTQRSLMIVCGTGGVGKTTLSAALAVRAALLGKNTAVITIDPAKRLANALGLSAWGHEPMDLTPHLSALYKKPLGQLTAFMPDTQETFKHFIQNLGFSDETIPKIMNNPIFKIFTKEFSGTHEYMALERLWTLNSQKIYDCIILDTPPSQNTLTFLNAPDLLSEFFDQKMARWFQQGWLSMGFQKAFQLLEKLTSSQFLAQLFEFAKTLLIAEKKFSTSLVAIRQLLQSPQVGFCMATTASPETFEEVLQFIQTLKQKQFQFEGILLNRTLQHLPPLLSDSPFRDHPSVQILQSLQLREKWVIDSFKNHHVQICAQLPEHSKDIHSMQDLLFLANG